jgi:hypothetical protein
VFCPHFAWIQAGCVNFSREMREENTPNLRVIRALGVKFKRNASHAA